MNCLSRFVPNRRCLKSATVLMGVMLGFFAYRVGNAQLVPFSVPGDDFSVSVIDRSSLNTKPAGRGGFVTAREGHFYVGKERIKFWGINLCFGANFPTHDEADKVAPHLAKLGVNAVRFHHMDMLDSPNGIWLPIDSRLKEKTTRKFDPEMIDRLDYFLAKLHEHGIYADLNMHVSRTLTKREGFPQTDPTGPWWTHSNKYVLYFDPAVQNELKQYCRDLLLHQNPYRQNLRRVDDPGIALIEMMNEDYFSKQGYNYVTSLPELFQQSFREKWNAWLKSQYATTDELRNAWKDRAPSDLSPMIRSESWEKELGNWKINMPPEKLPRTMGVEFPSEVSQKNSRVPVNRARFKAIRFSPRVTSENDYSQQISYPGFTSYKGQTATLGFWAKSDAPRNLRIEISSVAGGTWRSLGLQDTISLDSKWKHVSRVVTFNETVSKDAFLAFSFGDNTIPFEIAAVELLDGRPAGKLPDGQSLEQSSIGIPDSTYPANAIKDIEKFQVSTERSWMIELRKYLREELGVKIPITCSQLDYHADGLVAETMDFADIHEYWHHPVFPPGKEWSAEEWSVENEPMEAYPTKQKWPAHSLMMRTGSRPEKLPFTVSEWNYPEPGMYSAGCVPMAAMIASLQDWDGIFFFEYESFTRDNSTRSPYFKEQTNNFFSFNGSPTKLTAFNVFGTMFRRGDLKPIEQRLLGTTSNPIDSRLAFSYRLATSNQIGSINAPEIPTEGTLPTPDKSVVWKSDTSGQGTIQLVTPATMGIWGTIAGNTYNLGDQSWKVGDIDGGYGILAASSIDGTDLKKSKKIVVLASSRSENQGMKFNKNHNSVGSHWGVAPTLIAPIQASLRIPTIYKTAKIFAMDGTGKVRKEVANTVRNGMIEFEIGSEFQTLWYVIEQQ